MRLDAKEPIARFVLEWPGAMAIFESLGLDYACAGERSLDDAAHAEGIAPEIVLHALRLARTTEAIESWGDRPLADLTRHLVKEHHRLMREELAVIALRLADLCGTAISSDLRELRAAFTQLVEITLPHLHHEEENAFLAIEAIELSWLSPEPLPAGGEELQASLRHLADEHTRIDAALRVLRGVRLQVQNSDELPAEQQTLLGDLAALEAHLHHYMFVENFILFPRAIALAEAACQETTPLAR